MRDKWPNLSGIALGVCLTVLVFSLLLVTQVVIGPFLEAVAFGVPPYVVVALILPAAVWLGWFAVRKRYIRALPLWGVLLIVVVGWPLSAYGPIAARVFFMRRQAFLEVPMMADAYSTNVNVNWMAADSPPNTTFQCRSASPQQAIFDFYRQQLLARGWTEDTKSPFAQHAHLDTKWFLKRGKAIEIDVTYIRNQEIANQAPAFPYAVNVRYYPAWPY